MRPIKTVVEMKEYDTFNVVLEYRDDNHALLPLGDITVIADLVSTSGKLVEQLTIQLVADRSLIILTRDIVDDYLPYGTYRIDLIITDNTTQRRLTSPNIDIAVERGVTTPRSL